MEESERVVEQALGGGRPWWQACCLGCGIFLFAVTVAGAWFVHSLKGSGLRPLASLPTNIPANIQLYRAKEAVSIRHLPASQKRTIAERLLSPLRLLGIVASSTASDAPPEASEAMSRFASSTIDINELQVFNSDTLFVSWGAIPAVRSKEVLAFYVDMLEKGGFRVVSDRDEVTEVDIIAGVRPDASFQADVKGSAGGIGIDEIRVVVNYVGQ